MRNLLCLVLLATACVTARFEQFDASFDPQPAHKEPEWLEGGLLPSEYLMVGVIDVRHRETTPRHVVVDMARKQARGLGCDVVMPEPPHDVDEDGKVLAPEPGRTRFLCALPRPGGAPSAPEAMVP